MRISNFLIGIVLVALFVTVLSSYFAEIAVNRAVTSYDEDELLAYDKFSEVRSIADEMNNTIKTVEQGNAIDVLGGLVQSGYTIIKTTYAGVDAYGTLIANASNNTHLGGSEMQQFYSTAYIVGFILFLFALIGILVKKDA